MAFNTELLVLSTRSSTFSALNFIFKTSVFQAVKRRTSDSELKSVPQLSAVTEQVVSSDPLSISCTCQTDQRDVSTIIQLTNSLL